MIRAGQMMEALENSGLFRVKYKLTKVLFKDFNNLEDAAAFAEGVADRGGTVHYVTRLR